VISEGSCDTEDWSNDDKFTGINYTIYSHRKLFRKDLHWNNILQYHILIGTVLINHEFMWICSELMILQRKGAPSHRITGETHLCYNVYDYRLQLKPQIQITIL